MQVGPTSLPKMLHGTAACCRAVKQYSQTHRHHSRLVYNAHAGWECAINCWSVSVGLKSDPYLLHSPEANDRDQVGAAGDIFMYVDLSSHADGD